jgi:hypothetical protein
MPSCCINDFEIKDELRTINNPVNHYGGSHPDSIIWKDRWTSNGFHGPVLPTVMSSRQEPDKPKRLVYAPIYEEDAFPIQLKTKFGLRKYLAERYLVS